MTPMQSDRASVSVIEASFLVVDPCRGAADLGWCSGWRVAV